MIFRPTMRARAFLCAFALAGLLAACEQGPGDLCQRDSDCQAPLICGMSTRQCVSPGSTGDLDASVLYDAHLQPDADPSEEVPDAAPEVDAAPDFDAAPEFDAAPIDAAPGLTAAP